MKGGGGRGLEVAVVAFNPPVPLCALVRSSSFSRVGLAGHTRYRVSISRHSSYPLLAPPPLYIQITSLREVTTTTIRLARERRGQNDGKTDYGYRFVSKLPATRSRCAPCSGYWRPNEAGYAREIAWIRTLTPALSLSLSLSILSLSFELRPKLARKRIATNRYINVAHANYLQ